MLKFELLLPPGYNKISQLPPLIQANVLKALEDGMLVAEQKSKTKYLSGPRPEKLGVITGLLRSRVRSSVERGTKNIFAIGTLGVSGVVYAWIHELGGKTRPHPIVAKNAPYLVFFWKSKGIWMRIKAVNHPGSKFPPRPYLKPALEESEPAIVHLLQAAIDHAYQQGTSSAKP